jgi:hypothetical protein
MRWRCATSRAARSRAGLVAYGAADAERIAGKKSAEIEAILGYRGRDEMIHRDDMAMLEGIRMNAPVTLEEQMNAIGAAARDAARSMRDATAEPGTGVARGAGAVRCPQGEILAANAKEHRGGQNGGMSAALVDRSGPQ